jgi:predicted ribosome quality control (RQC) complex YloA/Tae2 family protein
MVTNYFTLFHMAAELEHEFSGRTIHELYTQHRGELVISFNETPAVLVAGCEPANNFLYVRKSFARARRNSANLFTDVSGTIIRKITMHPADRQIHIHLHDSRELVVQLFGSKANTVLVSTNKIITETFLKISDVLLAGSDSVRTEPDQVTRDMLLSLYADQSLAAALKHAFPQLGTVMVRELLWRTGLNGDQQVPAFLEQEIVRLLDAAKRLYGELFAPPSPRIYYAGTSPVRFSIIPLNHLGDCMYQTYSSLSEAIQTYRAHMFHEKSILREKENIVQVLNRERMHAEKALRTMAEEAEKPSRAKQYELFGKLLIAQIHLLKKGDAMAVVEDFVGGSNELVEIPLDPHLTPAKNAERYFEKAVKSRHAHEEQGRRMTELTQRQKSLVLLLNRMDEISSTDDLKLFREEHRSALSHFGLKAEKSGPLKKEVPLPFRIFTVAGGFQVWAGKSGENNDLLSTRHTATNDLWFHARGVGGSHVVLKVGTGKGEVSRQAIEQAAAIAAYYSKMKKSKLVPVTMCEGKYVRKPKGVPAGTVTVEREKTIFAEPALPPSQ